VAPTRGAVKSTGPVSISSVYAQRWRARAVTDNHQAAGVRSAMCRSLAAQIHWRRMARYRLGRHLLRQWKLLVESALRFGGQSRGLITTIPLRQTITAWRSRFRQRRVGRVFGGLGGMALAGAYAVVLLIVQTWRPQAAASGAMGRSINAPTAHGPMQPEPQPAAVLAGAGIMPAAASAPPEPLSRAQEIAQLKAQVAQAKQQALWRLRQSPQYQQAQAEHDRLEALVRELRAQDPYGELPQTSVKWIAAKSTLNRLTEQALRTDPDLRRAEEALERRRALP
jgi:hypothetical protein